VRIASLLYHDVVGGEDYSASGFPGGDADIYKLRRAAFEAHVDAVSAVARPTTSVESVLAEAPDRAVLFTFDDGGVGAIHHAAPLLEARGWRGVFFVATDWIGRPGFLDADQIRELHARGHSIGSHSCSHPMRMSHLPIDRMRAEWRDSVHRLEDVLGAPVRTASVPAGFYSAQVGDAAFEAGVTVVFNSEPTEAVRRVGDRMVLGRFKIMRDSPPALAAALAAGRLMPRLRQAIFWNAKKVVKAVGGEYWLAFRRSVLAGR
jgi:peptidoglycan/xylan/chitin deacetylase (PgdA/CDA1 family)